jgi:hypothetical protein
MQSYTRPLLVVHIDPLNHLFRCHNLLPPASLVSCSRLLMVQMVARYAILHAPILVHIDPLNHLFGCHNLLAPASLVSCSRVLMVQMLARHTILRLVLSLSCSLSVCVTLPSVCSVVWPVFESS